MRQITEFLITNFTERKTSLWAIVLNMFIFLITPTSNKQLEKYKKITVTLKWVYREMPSEHQPPNQRHCIWWFRVCILLTVQRHLAEKAEKPGTEHSSQVMPCPWRTCHRKYKGKLLQNRFEKILPCQSLKQLNVNISRGRSQTES